MFKMYKRKETLILSILLYGLLLVYLYQFILIAGKYKTFTTDEMFYYVEAKAISAYNIYQAPASLDGNTSYVGDFGFHGISYALKDGWLAKIFMHASDPPLVWNNFFTCLLIITLLLSFKKFSLNTRIKITLLVLSHYVLFTFTLSYMQETIHYFFAILALWNLYLIYTTTDKERTKYLYSYLLVIIIAITFRYNWFIWGLGLLPLSTSIKNFAKWMLITCCLILFGLYINNYLVAPYPYKQVLTDPTLHSENGSIVESLQIIVNHFFSNLKVYLSPSGKFNTTVMRYLLLILLFVSTWHVYKKRNRFIISTTLIGWAYFFSTLAFYHVYWGYDERALAVLNPLLAFSLIGECNQYLFYPYIVIQLFFFPGIVEETKTRNLASISANAPSPEYEAIENSYSKLKDLINDDTNTVVAANIDLIKHGAQSYFLNFPLTNCKEHAIHYRFYRSGNDLKGTHIPQYLLNPYEDAISSNSQLIYSDSWVKLYKLF